MGTARGYGRYKRTPPSVAPFPPVQTDHRDGVGGRIMNRHVTTRRPTIWPANGIVCRTAHSTAQSALARQSPDTGTSMRQTRRHGRPELEPQGGAVDGCWEIIRVEPLGSVRIGGLGLGGEIGVIQRLEHSAWHRGHGDLERTFRLCFRRSTRARTRLPVAPRVGGHGHLMQEASTLCRHRTSPTALIAGERSVQLHRVAARRSTAPV